MSTGFIPMVSTTPPPIDDDEDFGDFMDNKQDDFGDFSSHATYEDDSYPSLNSPPGITESMIFPSDDEYSPVKSSTFNKENFGQSDEEVETIFQQSKKIQSDSTIDNCDIIPRDGVNCESISPKVNGNTDSYDNPTSLSNHENMKNGDLNMQLNSADESLEQNNIHQEDIRDQNTTSSTSSRINESSEPDNQCEQTSEDIVPDEVSHENEIVDLQKFPIGEKSSNVHKLSSITDVDVESTNNVELSTNGSSSDLSTSESDAQNKISHETFQQTDSLSQKTENEDGFDNFAAFDDAQSDPTDDNILENKLEQISITSDTNSDSHIQQIDSQNIEDNDDSFANFQVSNDVTVQDDVENQNEEISVPIPDTSHETLDSAVSKNEEAVTDVGGEFNADFTDFNSVSSESVNTAVLQNKDDESCKANSTDTAFTKENIVENKDQLAKDDNAFECDFGAFESVDTNNDDDAGGFADFSDAVTFSTIDSKTLTEDSEKVDADFGSFSAGGNDDDFGDFSSGSAAPWSSAPITVKKVLTIDEKVGSYISKYTKRKDGDLIDEHIRLLDERMNAVTLSKNTDTPAPMNGESSLISWPGELWDHLEDIDNTIALNFIWNGSGHNKLLLDSLGMHTQNILFSGAKQAYYVPTYYAAGLGLIDPSKGVMKPMSAAEKITAISPTDKNAPAVEEELFPEAYPEWKTIADEHGSGKFTVVDDSGSWQHGDQIGNNSIFHKKSASIGDPIPIISSSMDLDYFDTLASVHGGVKMPTNTDLIDPELLELATAPTTEPPPPPKDSGTATLSKILASIKNTNNSPSPSIISTSVEQDNSKWEEEEKKLSPEARSVLQKLPDISFMRSKVLVFPMNMSRVNIGEDV